MAWTEAARIAAAATRKAHSRSTSLKKHSMYSESDLKYLKGKGYTTNEIRALWDRDAKAGNSPVHHVKAPDIVGVISDPNFYKKKRK